MGTKNRNAPEVSAPAGPAADDYPAIGDYAIVGDCRTAALISRHGAVEWLCVPHFSGASVFAALLDRRRGGRFAIRPAIPYETTRRYLGDSNVLETTFHTARGSMTLTDSMSVVTDSEDPAYAKPQRELLRRLRVTQGRIPVEVIYEPRPDYGRRTPQLQCRGKLGWACPFGDELLHLHSSLALRGDAHALHTKQEIGAGEQHYFSLTYVKSDVAVIPPLGDAAERRLQASIDWWQRWAARCPYDGPYRAAVIRSLLLLKLLTYALSGAVVAAPTTSLPEYIGGDMNWDYRYCWIRDASLTLRAFFDLDYYIEADGFLGWLLHTTRLTQPTLQVLYDVYGEAHIHERELGHLDGYRHSRPVRIGNQAANQLQLDIYGEMTLAAYDYVQRGGELDRYERRMLIGFGKMVCSNWHKPDHGIWERRGPPQQHTFSNAMCWATLDRLLKLEQQGLLSRVPVAQFKQTMNAIRSDIEAKGFDRGLNSYVAVYGSREIDASLLLLSRYGYCAPDNPRMAGTFECIKKHLDRDGLLLRTADTGSAPAVPEGFFGICAFWAVDYLAQRGELHEATARFERLLSHANDVGLYGEEMARDGGAPLGNFPQAYTHVGLITAALTLQQAQQNQQEATHVRYRPATLG